jgi:hypothetical protein
MKGLVIAALAFGVASLVSGCGGGSGGPASPAFDPFGSEPSGNSGEPSGATGEAPPAKQSIGDLCVTVCARFEALCPGGTTAYCAGSCAGDATRYPNCVPELQAFLLCADTTALTCGPSGGVAAESCGNSEVAFESCLQASYPGAGSSN